MIVSACSGNLIIHFAASIAFNSTRRIGERVMVRNPVHRRAKMGKITGSNESASVCFNVPVILAGSLCEACNTFSKLSSENSAASLMVPTSRTATSNEATLGCSAKKKHRNANLLPVEAVMYSLTIPTTIPPAAVQKEWYGVQTGTVLTVNTWIRVVQVRSTVFQIGCIFCRIPPSFPPACA